MINRELIDLLIASQVSLGLRAHLFYIKCHVFSKNFVSSRKLNSQEEQQQLVLRCVDYYLITTCFWEKKLFWLFSGPCLLY